MSQENMQQDTPQDNQQTYESLEEAVFGGDDVVLNKFDITISNPATRVGYSTVNSISGKLNSSFKIAKNGIDVHFVNGSYPDRILKVLKGRSYLGSMIKGDK